MTFPLNIQTPDDRTGTSPSGQGAAAPAREEGTAAPILSFTVRGIPKPKGSMRHVGHGRMIEQVNNAPWRDSIIWTVASAMPSPEPFTGPLRVEAAFTFPKPASAPKRRSIWPTTRASGDVDKHCRLLLDALQAAGALVDDAQVIELTACKRFPSEGPDALPFPGVVVHLYRAC